MKNKPYKLTSFYVGYKSYVEKKELLKTIHYMLNVDGTYDYYEIDASHESFAEDGFSTQFKIHASIGPLSTSKVILAPCNYQSIIGDFYTLDVALEVIAEVTRNDVSVIEVVYVCAGFNWGDVYRRHDANEKEKRDLHS